MTKTKEQWHIIFEGSDCCGKSTLIKEFNKATNFNHLLSDRGTISTRVYSKKFHRKKNGDFKKIEKSLASYPYHLLVYLTADKEDVIKRQSLKNDGYDSSEYDKDQTLFMKMIETSHYKNIIRLNSSEMSVEEEVDVILTLIEVLEPALIRKEKQCLKNLVQQGKQNIKNSLTKLKRTKRKTSRK